MTDNAAVARAMTSLATYDRIIEVYGERALSERGRLFVETCLRQRDLKRKEARR